MGLVQTISVGPGPLGTHCELLVGLLGRGFVAESMDEDGEMDWNAASGHDPSGSSGSAAWVGRWQVSRRFVAGEAVMSGRKAVCIAAGGGERTEGTKRRARLLALYTATILVFGRKPVRCGRKRVPSLETGRSVGCEMTAP